MEQKIEISGNRFSVKYRLRGNEKEAYAAARDICLEQTVEFPEALVPEGLVKDYVVGRIESFEPAGDGHFEAVVSYAEETAAGELTQLLNVIFGNISIKPGIRVEEISLSKPLLGCFKGPRYGVKGLRDYLKAYNRPLLSTALKPMGLSASQLAEYAYIFAKGGIDIIKDDHGITDQSFAPFNERVELCTKAVHKANSETGGNSIYVPNITAPIGKIAERARFSKDAGAGGLLISPGLTGFDAMRAAAEDDSVSLPVISHPAFMGSYAINLWGISHYAMFGQLPRLAGADATIYPNFGGRFSFSLNECMDIVRGAAGEMGNLKPSFPAPGGGMGLHNVKEMLEVYGIDVIFLIGGGLFSRGPDLLDNCRYFRRMVDKNFKE